MTLLAHASGLLADAPATWPEETPMSTLEALLIFVVGPALIFGVIVLLAMAPSLAKGPRYRLGQEWDAKAEWFGGDLDPGTDGAPQLPAGSAAAPDLDQGGASARW